MKTLSINDFNAPDSSKITPPFDGKNKIKFVRFFWWSWHPLYPYWSKSCWSGSTQEEAMEVRESKPELDIYHNKLIQENSDGSLIEVFDDPCQKMNEWKKSFQWRRKADEDKIKLFQQ